MDISKTQKNILVIEDNKIVSEAIVCALKKEGYQTDTAYDGLAGFHKIVETKPHMVILDILLPKLDGRDLLKKIKQNPDTKQIPVIIVSGKTEEWDKEIGFDLGADEYITKPFDPLVLVTHIKQIFTKKSGLAC